MYHFSKFLEASPLRVNVQFLPQPKKSYVVCQRPSLHSPNQKISCHWICSLIQPHGSCCSQITTNMLLSPGCCTVSFIWAVCPEIPHESLKCLLKCHFIRKAYPNPHHSPMPLFLPLYSYFFFLKVEGRDFFFFIHCFLPNNQNYAYD